MGYCFTKDNVRMRKSMKKNFARKVKRIKSRKRNREIRASYWGWCKWGDCKNLWRTITNNDMSFADKGIKQSGRTKDGKKFFDVKETRLMDILNVPITVVDFETNVKTKQGEGRYCVLFEQLLFSQSQSKCVATHLQVQIQYQSAVLLQEFHNFS